MKRGDGYGQVGHAVRWIRGGVTGGWGREEGLGPGGQELGRDHCGIDGSPPGPRLLLSVQPSVFVPTFLMLGPTQA